MGQAESIASALTGEFKVRFTEGSGTLSVHPRGVHFSSSRRRLLGHSTEERFVPAPEIRDVYREANGVRMDYRVDSHHETLQFWAEDAAEAASIVQQLPTARTIEMEETPRKPADVEALIPIAPRTLVMFAGLVVTAVVAAGGAIWLGKTLVQEPGVPMPKETTRRAISAGAQREQSLPAQAAQTAAPLATGSTSDFLDARSEYRAFAKRSSALEEQFRVAFVALQDGSLPREDFIQGLNHWLIPQWRSQALQLSNSTPPSGTHRETFHVLAKDVVSDWQSALAEYADGLKAEDRDKVLHSFALMSEADKAESEAAQLFAPE
jgi:hypothetical protein